MSETPVDNRGIILYNLAGKNTIPMGTMLKSNKRKE